MKEITCRELDGICDMGISGATLEELLDNRLLHLRQMAPLSHEHKRVLDNLQFLSENELAKWQRGVEQKWNNAPLM